MNATPNYVRKYLVKVLAKLAMQSGHAEDCIATLAHANGVKKFIGHVSLLKYPDRAHEVAEPSNFDAAVQLALLITQTDDHHVTPQAWVYDFFDGLKQRSVVVQGRDARNQLCLHDVLSQLEGMNFGYALKYAAKLCNGNSVKGGAV